MNQFINNKKKIFLEAKAVRFMLKIHKMLLLITISFSFLNGMEQAETDSPSSQLEQRLNEILMIHNGSFAPTQFMEIDKITRSESVLNGDCVNYEMLQDKTYNLSNITKKDIRELNTEQNAYLIGFNIILPDGSEITFSYDKSKHVLTECLYWTKAESTEIIMDKKSEYSLKNALFKYISENAMAYKSLLDTLNCYNFFMQSK